MKQLTSLVLLSVGLFIFAACAGDDQTSQPPAPTATTAAVPVPTATPTDPSASTATPMPVQTLGPTSVPDPTATPKPTAKPTEAPTEIPTKVPATVSAATATPEPLEPTQTPEPTAEPEPTPTPTQVPMPAFVIGSVSMKLEASDSAQGKKFGTYVAIDGTTIIAGSPADFSKGTNSGAALVFTKADGVWTEQAKSAGADTGIDLLGQVVAVSNDTVVLGATGDTPVDTGSGSAYVFARSGGVWTQQAKLIASDAGLGDQFGLSVAISGDTIIVGAPTDAPLGINSGSAYVFTRTGEIWTEQAKLTGSGQFPQEACLVGLSR